MSLWSRIKLIFKGKANSGLNKLEDPTQTLDLAYETMLEKLPDLRRAQRDAGSGRARLQLQMKTTQQSINKLGAQADTLVEQGNVDLAKEALTRKAAAQQMLNGLADQHQELVEQETHLANQVNDFQRRVEAFRTEKEAKKATYIASKAQVAIGDTLMGLGGDMDNAGVMLTRAQGQIEDMHAKASATNQMLESGTVPQVLTGSAAGDDIQAAIDSAAESSSVSTELAALVAKHQKPELEAVTLEPTTTRARRASRKLETGETQ